MYNERLFLENYHDWSRGLYWFASDTFTGKKGHNGMTIIVLHIFYVYGF
jgi:hypothetical protein